MYVTLCSSTCFEQHAANASHSEYVKRVAGLTGGLL